MKKLLSLIIVSFLSICAFADDGIFVEGTISKENATNTVNLMIETSNRIQAIGSYIYFPEGVKPVSIVSTCDVPVGYKYIQADEDGENYIIISYLPTADDQYIWPTTGPTCVGKITVEIDEDIVTGEYEIICRRVELSDEVGTIRPEDGYGDLIVQKAAVVESLGEGYSIDIVPAKMEAGYFADEKGTTLDIYYTAANDIVNMSFDIKLPNNDMYSTTDPVVPPVINNLIVTGTPAKSITIKATGDQSLNVSFEGVKSSRSSKSYINAATTPTKLATITIESEESLTDGIYDILIDNISFEEFNGGSDGNVRQGNNYSTLVVGTPEQNEAIIYGYCTSDATSKISTALKNVAIADVTAATVEDGVKFTDVLVNEKGGNSYYTRTSEKYGTTVLPYELTSDENCQLYTVLDMTSESIIIEEVGFVAANTPCIFKGTINVEGPTPTLGVPSEHGLAQTTFKGTYEATSIESGFGYYISSNGKFYGDGATIRPFRGYFDGAIAGAKALQVLLEDETGIKDITDQFSTEEIYNLMGVKMNNANKGVNIINGKKVYIK